MPTYHYKCDNCADEFEIIQSFQDKSLKKCKKCKKHKLNKVLYVPYVSITLGIHEIKSLDHLGRNNFDRDEKAGIIKESEQKKAEREAELDKKNPLPNGMKRVKTKKVSPWWRDGKVDQSLGDMSDKKREEYIMTGNK